MALTKYFEVLLMSKPRWPSISSYGNVKTSDEKFDKATKVVSLFAYPNIVLYIYIYTLY